MSEAGKGSGRRPLQVPKDQFNNNWDAIFCKEDDLRDRINAACAHMAREMQQKVDQMLYDAYRQVEEDERKEKEA